MSLMFFNTQSLNRAIPQIVYEPDTKTKSLFGIVAHALLVLYRQNKLSPQLAQYDRLLKRHAQYFPKQLPVHVQKQGIKQQFDYLLTYNQPVHETLEPALAFTLKQLCVDVMCENPARFGNLIVEGYEPKALRKMDNIDAPVVIQILASEILYVNVFVERHNDHYFLPVREYYMSETNGSPDLYLHFQDKYYTCPSDINEVEDEVA